MSDAWLSVFAGGQRIVSLSGFWWQIAVLVLALGLALFVRNLLKEANPGMKETEGVNRLRKISRKGLNRIQFPLTMLLATLIGKAALVHMHLDATLLAFATPLLLSLAGIRIAVYLLRKGFSAGPLLKAFENVISTAVWAVVSLHLLGWLPGVLAALDGLAFHLGGNRISLLLVIKLVITVALFWILALWLARLIEQRLHDSVHISESSRVALTKFSKFFLLALAILVGLDAAGIDLTALAVFGGAVGVGIGFGLQRITSNFISGFILLFDKSIKPGDVITIGSKFGWVQELRARYIVVRDRDGVETLIPNENLVTTDVINWSYSDKAVRLKLPVQISYGDDPEKAMQIMLDAAFASSRVLKEPVPLCRLMNFGDSGIELELRIWIQDPENGLGGVRSEVNLAIWRGFKEAGITIPFPQRDIHIKGGEIDQK
ncbi:MAG: mechanosensitive ion channel protein MscS [Zetaproteobacteria bacterium CG06_land_8_20_14_3_00_59_53]|nr:MAG: mechanosensitive ion channel protein MscS [Zetaproteobacteria bacterium CG2_30_59_37]PIO89241.1 MAG: mechanosensitive ion channel protein MscS [Zetaproteobacteria bacterium CG23_combo_of_CG06-09_8_20_14_all_59_86]PIQ64058.1 MAG: mechanosensitive ion channel protein MscS [Zetaproteobacteria bacterium CG11_big_fil_rev_8_21_14_0_20_59_439]PIU69620.1 MAG: mechanosensitive ion channel protein MscS [Zetaproteobacteria bacterium CG06_land_8_20_14_3_00_59_53]PIU96275.1 MAG: mechanosensitive ion